MGLPPGFGGGFGPPDQPPTQTGSDTGAIVGLIFQVFNLLGNAIRFVWAALIGLVNALVGLFRSLRDFLKRAWEDYIKKAITWLAEHVRKLRAWLKRTIGPIIKRLEKIKKWYDTHILKQQLRMLQQLQMVRRFLGILRLFHVKWAAKLDASLADVQNRIEQSIALVRGTLNQIITTLALVLDPALVLTRNLLGASLLTHLAAVKRIFAYGYHGPLTASETTFLEHNVDRYQTKTADSHIATLASSGLTDYDKSELTDFRAAISGITGTPAVL